MKKEMRGIFFPEMIASTIIHRPFPLPGPGLSLHVPGGWCQAVAPLYSHKKTVGRPKPCHCHCRYVMGGTSAPWVLQKEVETIPMGLRPLHILALTFSQPPLLPAPLAWTKILQEMKPQILGWSKKKCLKFSQRSGVFQEGNAFLGMWGHSNEGETKGKSAESGTTRKKSRWQ